MFLLLSDVSEIVSCVYGCLMCLRLSDVSEIV